ncbi:MAG TPA: hypothetical protein PLQ76_08465 [bacterium]|nr:hypothetical protein [bacterium]
MRRMTIITAAAMMLLATSARATDFWGTYAKQITGNYAVKTGVLPSERAGDRLGSDDIAALATKSFSQSFGTRFAEVARDTKYLLIVCMFSREPERCYMENVVQTTFGEIKFVSAPRFSQRFLKKFGRFYSTSLSQPKNVAARRHSAAGVPRYKNVNPRFGFVPNDMEIVAAMPFYTYFGIYAEPKWGTAHGFGLNVMVGKLFTDVTTEGVAFRYSFNKKIKSFGTVTLTVRPEGEFFIDNTFLQW